MNLKYGIVSLLLIAGICIVAGNIDEKVTRAAAHQYKSVKNSELPEPGRIIRSEKIDPVLVHMAEGVNDKPNSPVKMVESLQKLIKDGMVDVVIKSGGVADENGRIDYKLANSRVNAIVKSVGGQVRAVHGNNIYARINPGSSADLAASANVNSITLQEKPVSHEVSEGLEPMGVNAIRDLLPYRTKRKVKICIIDGGFRGYKDLLGTELPKDVIVKDFSFIGDPERGGKHGTACAEIVHDIVPEAELHLVSFGGSGDFKRAIDYAIENEIDVISFSMGFLAGDPGNGINIYSDIIKLATSKGIVFVTSAGNNADDHWSGTFNDPDGNGWHNYEDGSEILQIKNTKEQFAKGYLPRVFLQWDDWGTYNEETHSYSGSDQDFAMVFYYKEGEKWIPFPNNYDRIQNGSSWPIETSPGFASTIDMHWGIRIKKVKADKSVRFDMLVLKCPAPLQFTTPEGSVGCPATSDHVLAVGAVGWEDDELHYYSSQGPTLDGRIKPELTSYAGNSTISYGKEDFYGTSASCPHAAGAIGLIMSKTGFTAKEAVEILKARTLDKGEKGMDNKYGLGVLKLTVNK